MLTMIKRSVIAIVATVVVPPVAYQRAVVSPNAARALQAAPPSVARVDAARRVERPHPVPPAEPIKLAEPPAPEIMTASVERRMAANEALSPALTPTKSPLAKLPLHIADNLKVSFYETIEVGGGARDDGKAAPAAAGLKTFYQRMDLSGDYLVEQDGGISIPLLGRVQVEGRGLEDVRAEIAAAFTTATGRIGNIDIRVLDRSPVYVVGAVKTPGAYKYSPGMIVLQVVALAGGRERVAENMSGMVSAAREMERARLATLQIDQLMAHRARLVAERAGGSVLSAIEETPLPPRSPDRGAATPPAAQQPTESAAGNTTAAAFLTEGAILDADVARRRQQNQGVEAKAAALRNELSALKQKMIQVEAEKRLKSERIEALQVLEGRGVVTTNNVLTLRAELAELESRRQDSLVGVIQGEARLAEAESEGEQLTSETATHLTQEIAAVDKDLSVAKETYRSATSLIPLLCGPCGAASQPDFYQIVRKSGDGSSTMQASETTPLMPGDVLKVDELDRTSAPAGSTPGSFLPSDHAEN